MKISTKGRYAVRLMLDVAIHGMDKNVSIFVAFSDHDAFSLMNVDIITIERDHFPNMHPGRGKQVDDS